MEGLQPIYRRVAGIDVHRTLHVVTVVIEQPDGSIEQSSREFGGYKRDCRALSVWLVEMKVELPSSTVRSVFADFLKRKPVPMRVSWVLSEEFV